MEVTLSYTVSSSLACATCECVSKIKKWRRAEGHVIGKIFYLIPKEAKPMLYNYSQNKQKKGHKDSRNKRRKETIEETDETLERLPPCQVGRQERLFVPLTKETQDHNRPVTF